MKPLKNFPTLLLVCSLVISATSCVTPEKMDKFIGLQYDNKFPAQKKKSEIKVTPSLPADTSRISFTTHKLTSLLPLIVYWRSTDLWEIKLNQAFAVTNFANTLNGSAGKIIQDKLHGQKLELTIEQVPSDFAIDAIGHIVWVIYAFSWEKDRIRPDVRDLVVSYKYQLPDGTPKSGKITVKNTMQIENMRYLQSWRSAISEHLTEYNASIIAMTKSFASQLAKEI